jgi:tetratricopeptide (TPR) repeat protein
MEYFRQALALEPQNAEFHHYLGMALERSGRRDGAKESFERSAELGGPLETRVGLARIYLEQGEVSRAIDELNLVLDENPGDDEAKELLSRAMDRAETDQRRAEQRAEFATHRLDRLETIIEDLTVTNRDLENRVLALQTDRQNMEMELEQLRAYRSRKEEQFGERMDKAIKSIEQLSGNEEIDRLRQDYTSQVRALEEELAETRRAAETVERLKLPENGDVAGELLKERERGNSLEGRLRILEGELARSEAKAEGYGLAVETMKEKDDGERREVSRLQERLASQQQDREEKTRELSRLAERNSSLSTRVQQMEKELGKAQKEAAKLLSESKSWRENKGSRKREFASLREQISSLQSEKKSLEREISSTKERSGSLSGEKARVEEDLSQARAELEEARRAAEELQSRLVAVERESYQRIEEARGKAAGEVSARDEDLAALRGELAGLQSEMENLRRESLGREEELRRLQGEAESRAVVAEGLAQQAVRRSEQLGESLARVRLDLAEQALGLGRYHMKNRSWDKARAAFEKVLEIDMGNGEAYYSLGEIYFQLGHFELSKEMYQKAKEIF